MKTSLCLLLIPFLLCMMIDLY